MIRIVLSSLFLWLAGPALAESPFSELEAQLSKLEDVGDQLTWLRTLEPRLSEQTLILQGTYWYWLGMTQDRNGLIEEAIASFTQAIKTFESVGDVSQQTWALSYIERSYMRYLQSNSTADYCPDRQQALVLAEQGQDPAVLVRALIQVAYCFDDAQSALVEGLAHLQRAIALAEKQQLSKKTEASVYNATANLYQQNYLLDKAYEYALKAHEAYSEQGALRDSFDLLHSLAGLAPYLMKFDEAKAHVQALFTLAEQHPEHPDFAFFSELNAGLLAHNEKDHAVAITHLERAWDLKNTTEETYFVREVERHLVLNYFRAERFDEANTRLLSLKQRHPQYVDQTTDLDAIQLLNQGKPTAAFLRLYDKLDAEVSKRNLFITQSGENSTHIHNNRLTVMDNRLLQQELEIQRLRLAEEQSQSRIARLSLAMIVIFVTGLLILTWYLHKSRKDFQHRANTDGLTGIANRRRIFQLGEQLATSPQPLSVMVFDVDHFKHVNDTLGHQYGDSALKRVVAQAQRCLRRKDELGRIGGEEFLLLLPDTTSQAAEHIAERVRSSIAREHIRKNEQQLSLSVSIGVACQQPQESLEALVARADNALYQAKDTGRNKVVSAI